MKKTTKHTFWKFLAFIPVVAFSSVTIVACGTTNVPDLATIDQFNFDYNKKHHFANPLFKDGDQKNQIIGIDLPNGGASPTSPGNGFVSRAKLLTKKLPNEKYVDLAKRSYALEMVNGAPLSGTAWILDYKLASNGAYPTTWYFGSNAHVLDDLRIKNNKAYPYNYAEWIDDKFPAPNTSKVNLIQPKDPSTSSTIENYTGIASDTNGWKKASIDLTVKNPDGSDKEWKDYYSDNPAVKTIFLGNDFLETDPKDYLDPKINVGSKYDSWFNNKEYADFGVIEVNFPSETIAKDITNDYANWPKEKQFQYKQNDLIQKYERKQQYLVSFPNVGKTDERSLTINKQESDYKNEKTNGGELGKSPYYSTFKSKPSIMDAGIGLSFFGANLEKYDNTVPTNDFVHYNSWGLMYQLSYANVDPGASGSLIMDEDGNSLGLLFGSDQNASTGLIQAFYSNGFSYSGYYGKYELPAYDLIRGGKSGQKKSYYDGLVSFYGKSADFKTNLFPNGLVNRS